MPKQMPTVIISARVSPQFRAMVYASAEQEGQTAAAFIIGAISAHTAAWSPTPIDPELPMTTTEAILAIRRAIGGGDRAHYEYLMDEISAGWLQFRAWEASRRVPMSCLCAAR